MQELEDTRELIMGQFHVHWCHVDSLKSTMPKYLYHGHGQTLKINALLGDTIYQHTIP